MTPTQKPPALRGKRAWQAYLAAHAVDSHARLDVFDRLRADDSRGLVTAPDSAATLYIVP